MADEMEDTLNEVVEEFRAIYEGHGLEGVAMAFAHILREVGTDDECTSILGALERVEQKAGASVKVEEDLDTLACLLAYWPWDAFEIVERLYPDGP